MAALALPQRTTPAALCAPSDGGLVAGLALRAGVPTETLGTVQRRCQRDSSGWPGPLGTRPLPRVLELAASKPPISPPVDHSRCCC